MRLGGSIMADNFLSRWFTYYDIFINFKRNVYLSETQGRDFTIYAINYFKYSVLQTEN